VAILANAAIASVAVRFDNVACQASP
jgi:hypothetical protein